MDNFLEGFSSADQCSFSRQDSYFCRAWLAVVIRGHSHSICTCVVDDQLITWTHLVKEPVRAESVGFTNVSAHVVFSLWPFDIGCVGNFMIGLGIHHGSDQKI